MQQVDLSLAFRRLTTTLGMPARKPVPESDDDLIGVPHIMQMTGMSKDWVYETFQFPAKGGLKPARMGPQRNAPLRWRRLDVKVWIANQVSVSR